MKYTCKCLLKSKIHLRLLGKNQEPKCAQICQFSSRMTFRDVSSFFFLSASAYLVCVKQNRGETQIRTEELQKISIPF